MKKAEKVKKATDSLFDYLELFNNKDLQQDVGKIIGMYQKITSIGKADDETEKIFAYILNTIRINQDELIKEFYE